MTAAPLACVEHAAWSIDLALAASLSVPCTGWPRADLDTTVSDRHRSSGGAAGGIDHRTEVETFNMGAAPHPTPGMGGHWWSATRTGPVDVDQVAFVRLPDQTDHARRRRCNLVRRRSSFLATLLSALLALSLASPARAANSAWDPNDTKNVLDLKWVGIYRQDPDTTRVSITFWNPVRDWMLRWHGAGARGFGLSLESLGMLFHDGWGLMYINYGRNPYGHLAWQATLYDGGSSGRPRTIPRGAPEPLHLRGVASQLRTSRMSRSRLTEGLGWWTKSHLQDGSSQRWRARCPGSDCPQSTDTEWPWWPLRAPWPAEPGVSISLATSGDGSRYQRPTRL